MRVTAWGAGRGRFLITGEFIFDNETSVSIFVRKQPPAGHEAL